MKISEVLISIVAGAVLFSIAKTMTSVSTSFSTADIPSGTSPVVLTASVPVASPVPCPIVASEVSLSSTENSSEGPGHTILPLNQTLKHLTATGDRRFHSVITSWGSDVPRCTKKGCLPDFITIGAQKGGTTSLYHYLQGYHKAIVTSRNEELNFFTERYQQGLDWLREQFPKGEHLKRGYKSPNYLPHPLAPQRMSLLLPTVKLVVLLREPISRARSGWQMAVGFGKERRSFEAAASEEIAYGELARHG